MSNDKTWQHIVTIKNLQSPSDCIPRKHTLTGGAAEPPGTTPTPRLDILYRLWNLLQKVCVKADIYRYIYRNARFCVKIEIYRYIYLYTVVEKKNLTPKQDFSENWYCVFHEMSWSKKETLIYISLSDLTMSRKSRIFANSR